MSFDLEFYVFVPKSVPKLDFFVFPKLVFLLTLYINKIYNSTMEREILRQMAIAQVGYNSDLLDITPPKVSIVPAYEMEAATVQAATSEDGNHIAINENYIKFFMDKPLWLAMTMAHETRHAWQVKTGEDFSEYRTSQIISTSEYNCQRAEIDAWAWAFLVVESFGNDEAEDEILQATETLLGDAVANLVCGREDELFEDFFRRLKKVRKKRN